MGAQLKTVELTTDTVAAYLNNVGQHELLTADEEVMLAQTIEEGKSAEERIETKEYDDLSERRKLGRAMRRGEDARHRFVNSNLRLVVSQARRYRNTPGMDFIDLIQEGNLGLMRAVEKFDWRKGFKFSTYATWWIRQAIQRGIAEKSRTVRIPGQLHDKANLVHAVADRLRAETGREPTMEELVGETGLEQKVIEDALALQESASLEAPVGEDGAVLGDFVIGDIEEDDPVFKIEELAVSDDLRSAVSRLPDRERRILALRFGFVDGVPRPLDEIGDEFGLTAERIRQIEKRALTRMRHPSFGLREHELV
ncbi:MAG: sigma-70 family RNA polymerase sigma factor [Acidimicrobiia bacterium]|nr:sigma-70 family RNA polymerase sigma factor [Acidimicrobiia bacterium]